MTSPSEEVSSPSPLPASSAASASTKPSSRSTETTNEAPLAKKSGSLSIPFYDSLHVSYVSDLPSKLNSATSYEGAVTEHLRMSGVYWSLTALSMLRSPEEVDRLMNVTTPPSPPPSTPSVAGADIPSIPDNIPITTPLSSLSIIDWVFACYDSQTGGFGGNIGHDAHILYTLSAVQILALANCLGDPRLDRLAVGKFVVALQRHDGSFAGDVAATGWGDDGGRGCCEIDTRFTYCALSTLSILGLLPNDDDDHDDNDENNHKIISHANVQKAAQYVLTCRNNFDGGFGCVPGAESHAGQIFCCIGALAISKSLHLLQHADVELLTWWLAERQCDSGGLNGRPEKQADVCYSWWILSALSILGRVSYINDEKLAEFILRCQDDEEGGIADRPGDVADVFHTFFGVAGLSLLGYLDTIDIAPSSSSDDNDGEMKRRAYRKIDPIYALPTDVVERLRLKGQVLSKIGKHSGAVDEEVDDRLKMYDILRIDNYSKLP